MAVSTAGARAAATRSAVAVPLTSALRQHRGLVLLIGAYVLTTLVLPTMTPVAISDDWAYTRSVEVLLTEGRLQILDVAVSSAIPQILWGLPFAAVFGDIDGALRVATVVFLAATSVPFYALARLLGVGRNASMLGVAIYLFNPLSFVLGYTFMTDPYFVGLLVVSTYFFARATAEDRLRYIWIGSSLAALASLQRLLGLLVPAAVFAYWVWNRSVRIDRATLRRVLGLGLPFTVVLLYTALAQRSNEGSYTQDLFLDSVLGADVGDWVIMVGRLVFLEAMYAGLLLMPLAVIAVPAVPRLVQGMTTRAWGVFGLLLAVLVAGFVTFGGRAMPYVGQFVNAAGLGPGDLLGERPIAIAEQVAVLLTVVCGVGALAMLLAICAMRRRTSPRPLGLVGMIGGLQALGVALPSFYFFYAGGSLDRYLLPVIPFALWFALVALRDVKGRSIAAWAIAAFIGVFSMLGTRDYLVFQGAVWEMAHNANEAGVANTQLDAGAAWTGRYLWEYSYENDIEVRTPGGPWWTSLYGPATDSTYVVSSTLVPGYEVLEERHYSSWLTRQPTPLYLSRREE